MDVFELRDHVIGDYESFVGSFLQFRDSRIKDHVTRELADGHLWPEPRVGLNPSFESGGTVGSLVDQGILHPECRNIFRVGKQHGPGSEIRFHRHQVEAIEASQRDANYVLTTGTGSGKSLAYIVPIVDHVLRTGSGQGIKAIVVYPMNALANSQREELDKFLDLGFGGRRPVTYARYTGQESREEKDEILANPPDVILTNYVMLELILTRITDRRLVDAAANLRFLVLDELHTYRGRQGADVSFLVRRLRQACGSAQLRCVGTSATMATGSYEERQRAVAEVASELFGAAVHPHDVIGETLRRSSPEIDLDDPASREAIAASIRTGPPGADVGPEAFLSDPLTSWIESTFGVHQVEGRWERVTPRPIGGPVERGGAAAELAEVVGLDCDEVERAVRAHLLAGARLTHPATGFPIFAFRLHQFISRGDTVYATVDAPSRRTLTLREQRTAPADPAKVLLPLSFCRACGQEYYSVFRDELAGSSSAPGDDDDDDAEGSAGERVVPRAFGQRTGEQGQTPGYLYLPPDQAERADEAWPSDPTLVLERVPEDWIDPHAEPPRIKPAHRDHLPQEVWVGADGRLGSGTTRAWWVPAPFRFCLACGIAYGGRVRSEATKLATLGSGGRSSAMTELSISALRWLRRSDLQPEAQKLLAFTDNRQDASLQAGHFNDFVMVTMVRAALVDALDRAGPGGLRHDELALEVFRSLDLPIERYAVNPQVRFAAREEVDRALRDVLAYLLYRDLERGWRVTQPNLEQTGLLHFGYVSLDELAAAEDVWAGFHPALAQSSPSTRAAICQVICDHLRRSLVIDVDVLSPQFQERMLQWSDQYLIEPFAIDEDRRELHQAGEACFRSRRNGDYGGFTFLSPRGAVGQFLRRRSTFPDYGDRPTVEETTTILGQLAEALVTAGILRHGPNHAPSDPTYRLAASAMIWQPGDGEVQVHDPLRVARPPKDGLGTNRFFADLYRSLSTDLATLSAKEHTAQVRAEDRIEREEAFRRGELAVLYCSPTMELGVDISQLNVVGMRNVPPTPANYAQRSGRAGRSGQPALVFTYATSGSPHDQYYFRRPEKMVSGRVEVPRIDLANEDLVRSHVHAVWLSVSGLRLGTSMREVVDLDHVEGARPVLQPSIEAGLSDPDVHTRARRASQQVLESVRGLLDDAPWWYPNWLDDVLAALERRFRDAAQRWWDLYRTACAQRDAYNRVIANHTVPAAEKQRARRLRDEAERRIELLIADTAGDGQRDFDPYRYFAAEGFLPGYSFPRLPLTAYIPGRRGRSNGDYLQRARFLAISEFGPRALIYHEGSRYRITNVDLPVVAPSADEPDNLVTSKAKRCESCGYLHPLGAQNPDVCERCGAALGFPLRDLFRLQNVTTRRVDRINSDEEERQRQGFDIISGVRFATRNRRASRRRALIEQPGKTEPWGHLTYAPTATLWRLNLGWRHRKDRHQHGFVLDLTYGTWARNDTLEDEDDPQAGPDDRVGTNVKRVIPYVEDTRNVLLIEPSSPLPAETMASLESALARAIQVTFQLEESELATEPLPTAGDRRLLLFYESAEGGAGVLRHLVHDPTALARVARCALELCHVDPDTGEDLPGEHCAVACYECLLSYTNQRDHQLLDRRRAIPMLVELARATVAELPDRYDQPDPDRDEVDAHRKREAESELEERFLDWLRHRDARIPQRGERIDLGDHRSTTPDFVFPDANVAIYVDGPPHDFPDRQARDAELTDALRDLGWRVARFGHDDDWAQTLDSFASAFGVRR